MTGGNVMKKVMLKMGMLLTVFLWVASARAETALDGKTFTYEQIETAMSDALVESGAGDAIEIENMYITLEGGERSFLYGKPVEASLTDSYYLRHIKVSERSERFEAELEVDPESQALGMFLTDTKALGMEIRGRYKALTRVPVVSRAIKNGDIIVEDDIAWQLIPSRDVRHNTIKSADSLIGKTARRVVEKDSAIRSSDINAPVVVSRQSLVTLVYANGAMQLKTQGYAMNDGAEGELIRVRNARSNTIVHGVVTPHGYIRVDMASVPHQLGC